MAEEQELTKRSIFGEMVRHLRATVPVWLHILLLLPGGSLAVALHFRWSPYLSVLFGIIFLFLLLIALNRVLPSQLFWGSLLCAALVTYGISLGYQAGAPARVQNYQAWATPQLPDSPENLTLAITYPRLIPLEAPDKPGWPLSVHLRLPPPTATVTPSSQPGQTITPTLTSASTITFTVAFEPQDDGLIFTNEKGVPVAPQLMLNLGEQSEKPAGLYLRRALADTVPVSIPITVQVYGLDGTPDDLTTINVELEDEYHAWWRHFRDLVLGPTTPLLAVAAALLGFGLQQWQEWQKQRQARLAEIEQILALASESPSKAARKFVEVRCKAQQGWKDPFLLMRLAEVQAGLESYAWRQELLREGLQGLSEEKPGQTRKAAEVALELDRDFSVAVDLQHAAEMLQAFQESLERWLQKVEELGTGPAVATLIRIGKEYDRNVRPVLAKLLADLAGRSKYVKTVAKHLEQEQASRHLLREPPFEERLRQVRDDSTAPQETREAARRLLVMRQRPFSWPRLWPTERPTEPPAIVGWLKQAGLAFNPFGPEQAEEDPRLPKLRVDPPGWKQIKAPVPTIVFGAAGSGKTAALMLLAEECTRVSLSHPGQNGDLDTFPVRFSPLLGVLPEEARHAYLDMLTFAIARSILDFLAQNPYTFLETPYSQRSAVARLLTVHQHRLGDWSEYLQGTELDKTLADRLAGEITQVARGIKPSTQLNETEWLMLVAEARLHHFQQYYVVADVSSGSMSVFNLEEFAAWLRPLLGIMRALTSVNVYLKISLPDSLQLHLDDIEGLQSVALTWTDEALHQLLTTRLRATGAESLRVLCDPSVPHEPSPDERLVRAAKSLPRELIRQGNALLKSATKPKLSENDLDAVLGSIS